MITVCGLAGGRRTTKEAARGALCFRDYATADEADKAISAGDWIKVISVTESKKLKKEAH